jgi:hypothetical protein
MISNASAASSGDEHRKARRIDRGERDRFGVSASRLPVA